MFITVEIDVQITDEDIDDIMCSALEGGINYWCYKVKVVDKYLGEYASEQISRGGMLLLFDSEDVDEEGHHKTYILNKEKLIEGIRLGITKNLITAIEPTTVTEKSGFIVKTENVYRLETGNMDANDADLIVQFALFGEVMYG